MLEEFKANYFEKLLNSKLSKVKKSTNKRLEVAKNLAKKVIQHNIDITTFKRDEIEDENRKRKQLLKEVKDILINSNAK